jgi:thiol-disulfide isomerase/thioredoxin
LSTVSVISPTDHSQANYKVGSTMGDFTLTDTNGNSYNLSQLLKEKDLVILNFWFVNCGPCKAEFPYFEAINEKYDNVQLLTMNHLDSEKDILALREQMGVTFPMISENIGFQQGFGITAYPTTVFIAPNGKILKIKEGDFRNQAELETLIESLLK